MSDAVLIPLMSAGFLAVFSILWLGVTGLLGRMSGWATLEQAFPDHPEPPVETLRF